MSMCSCGKNSNPALIASLGGAGVILFASLFSVTSGSDSQSAQAEPTVGVLEHTMTTLVGEEQSLEEYKGDVVLIVNTASKCGLTPQYEGLEALYREHKDDGFVVLGFPANNFGKQEPGSDEEIAEFCEMNYGVSFPMFSKISVKGDDIHPLYQQLTSMPEPIGGEVQWNFQKYVVDRSGSVVAMFGPRTAPDNAELVAMIETLLEEDAD